MRSKILTSVKLLLAGAVVVTVVVNFWLPPMSGGLMAMIVGAFIQFMLITLGPITAMIMGEVYPEPLTQPIVASVGLIALLAWLVSIYAKKGNLPMYASLTAWLSVGGVSTFWGLAYGV